MLSLRQAGDQRAYSWAPKDPESILRHEPVQRISHKKRQKSKPCSRPPRPVQQVQNPPRRFTALMGPVLVNQQYRAGIQHGASFSQGLASRLGVQRRVMQASSVVAEQPPDHAVAQAASAIKEEDRPREAHHPVMLSRPAIPSLRGRSFIRAPRAALRGGSQADASAGPCCAFAEYVPVASPAWAVAVRTESPAQAEAAAVYQRLYKSRYRRDPHPPDEVAGNRPGRSSP